MLASAKFQNFRWKPSRPCSPLGVVSGWLWSVCVCVCRFIFVGCYCVLLHKKRHNRNYKHLNLNYWIVLMCQTCSSHKQYYQLWLWRMPYILSWYVEIIALSSNISMARGPVHADTNGGGGTSFGFGSPLDALLHIFGAREAWCRWCMMPFGKKWPLLHSGDTYILLCYRMSRVIAKWSSNRLVFRAG